ncbi:hypothetical protein GCM10022291_07170 [Postechiella marina]|uniref:Xylose isomerase-like TIM barrel domain-containing protein n=1 Tax=Postechiella marina TaxID=943941 RepID=A0ABP8C258_9FLAO
MNNVTLGAPLFEDYKSPEQWVSILKRLKYKAAYCPLEIGAKAKDIESYKIAAQDNNIIIAEVGAWSNPISINDKERADAIDKNIKSLELAERIEANCCVNISGTKHPEKWAAPHKDNLTSETFDLIVETTQKIIDAVNPKYTYYTLEAMPWAYPNSINSYLKLIKAIDRKHFAVHLDPVNLISSPEIYFSNGTFIKKCFKKLGPYIKSCHAKDILLKDNCDLPQFIECQPGLGKLNYSSFLKELSKLNNIPLLFEHLKTAEQYKNATNYVRSIGKINNIVFS